MEFPADDGYEAADLAHPAALPRIGDSVEYLDEAGVTHRYRVRDVIHVLQASPRKRPAVGTLERSPTGPGPQGAPQRVPEAGELRSGLPIVVLESIEPGSGSLRPR